jgi:monofunctional biosynthetic peptidoglycan transglycosylase
LAEIAPALPRAVIAAEDNLFCRHGGVDWSAFAAEWTRWRAGERPRGASTITMQLTRNLFLWPHRDPVRKALELAFAPVVDALVTKRRQLELYLNQVELGPGIYGAEAAARYWFDKSADRLTPTEAAALVALLPAPLVYTPAGRRDTAQRVARRVDQLGLLLDCAP